MPKFIMLIGPAGCGKSTYAKQIADDNTVILSSDMLRKELLGSEDDQSANNKIFNEMNRRAREYLMNDVNVIWDATSISRKRRIGTLQQMPVKSASGEKVTRHAVVICTRIENIIKQDVARMRTVGKDVIMKHLMGFQPPCEAEGFDDIKVEINDGYTLDELLDMMKNCPHDNPHHSDGSVYDHCFTMYTAARREMAPVAVIQACLYHDCGKPFTKFYDEEGIAHYYGHDGVGAYVYLAAGGHLSTAVNLDVAVMIGEHMQFFHPNFKKERLEKRIGHQLLCLTEWLHRYDSHPEYR